MEICNFHNNFHYGDCLTSLHFLIKLSQVNDIKCNFFCNPNYHHQLNELIPENTNVFLVESEYENSLHLWGGGDFLGSKVREKYDSYPFYCKNYPQYTDVLEMLFSMWKCVCEEKKLVFPFENKKGLLFDESTIEIAQEKIYDWIIVNSYCLSGQMNYSPEEQDKIFLNIIEKLIEKNKTFITTHKLKDFPSTQDNNLSLVQIAQISKNCKVIMGVPTSPFWICMNKWSFENCQKFINLTHDSCTFDLGEDIDTENKFKTVNSLQEVLEYID
jgi:hypothetical protein